jgi:hypothetical protein
VRGIWKLWAYDDTLFETGEIADAVLTIGTEFTPDAAIAAPVLPFTSTQPSVHVEGARVARGVQPCVARGRLG